MIKLTILKLYTLDSVKDGYVLSVWMFIYKFLNVCPFDYTAVAVSGKVERS